MIYSKFGKVGIAFTSKPNSIDKSTCFYVTWSPCAHSHHVVTIQFIFEILTFVVYQIMTHYQTGMRIALTLNV